jgi:hypothetical protein
MYFIGVKIPDSSKTIKNLALNYLKGLITSVRYKSERILKSIE